MEIILGKTAGFCYGVKRAVDGAKDEVKENNEVYCLGEIVHNKNVVKKLEEDGIKFIDKIEDAKGKTIIRAHGIPKETYKKAKEMNIEIKDLTCPHVLKIHEIAEKYSKKGYFIVLLGKQNHPEVIGIESFCGTNMVLIEDEKCIDKAVTLIKKSNIKDVIIIAQTTYNSKKFDEIVNNLKNRFEPDIKLEVSKTICPATEIRQKETENTAKQVDVMVIIGDKKSSNTNKLYNIACNYCNKVIFIENDKELNIGDFYNVNKIGIMAGASTPKEDINGVIKYLENGGIK